MHVAEETNESWLKEKEILKLKFKAITNKYSMFEETDKSAMSEKLQGKLAKTKETLHKIIAAM
ncbi:MAG TPA: hypothetical protein VNV85_00405 [Puia sp.]|jgi:hypothetical protein|nr:hypothetical protein [Puia sp.]